MILATGVDIFYLVKKEEMECILLSDTGTYWCAIPRIFSQFVADSPTMSE